MTDEKPKKPIKSDTPKKVDHKTPGLLDSDSNTSKTSDKRKKDSDQ